MIQKSPHSRSFSFDLAGQCWDIPVATDELNALHIPLVRQLLAESRRTPGRFIVFIAGPPGSGKSTLTALWQQLAGELDPGALVQCLPMDGFHFPNAILDAKTIMRDGRTVPLRRVKGAPESFDFDGLSTALMRLAHGEHVAWPVYDRNIHDPIPDALDCSRSGILLVEGNYLLLDEAPWRDLQACAARTIFIKTVEELVRDGVIARACRGGKTKEEAERHYGFNDSPNWHRVMSARLPADIVLHASPEHRLARASSTPSA